MKSLKVFLLTFFILSLMVCVYLFRIYREQKAENKLLWELIYKTKAEMNNYREENERYRLQEETSGIRRLYFSKPINYKTMEKETIKGIIQKKAEEEITGGNTAVEDYNKVLVKFGFLKPGIEIMSYIADLYEEQVQGMYDEETGDMALVKGLPLTGSLQRVFMVHELTHALQDQNFNLKSIISDSDNEDRSIAALALVEGDATLVMSLYYKKHFKFSQLLLDAVSYLSVDQSVVRNSPYYLRENLLFPYKFGMNFVIYVYKEQNGWQGVNKVFKDLPKSTEQIMHPEKYKNDEPVEVSVKQEMPEQWRELDRDTLGEFNIRVLLAIYLGVNGSIEPSEGWGGDQWAMWENKENGRIKAVWDSVWDTKQDAEQFFNACRKVMRKMQVDKARLLRKDNYVEVIW